MDLERARRIIEEKGFYPPLTAYTHKGGHIAIYKMAVGWKDLPIAWEYELKKAHELAPEDLPFSAPLGEGLYLVGNEEPPDEWALKMARAWQKGDLYGYLILPAGHYGTFYFSPVEALAGALEELEPTHKEELA